MPWGQPQQRHPMKRIPKGHFTVFNQAGAHYEAKNVTWTETISMVEAVIIQFQIVITLIFRQ